MLPTSSVIYFQIDPGPETHKIRSNNSINTLRFKHHPRSHRIHEHLINLYFRELSRHLLSNLIPKHHPVPLRIALRDNRDVFFRSLCRCFKRKAHDAFHAMTCKDRDFGGSFPWLVDVGTSPVTGVLAL
jgi:hypothetical protein